MMVKQFKVGVLRYAPPMQWGATASEQTAAIVSLLDGDGIPGVSVTWGESPSIDALVLTIAAWLSEAGKTLDPARHPNTAHQLFNRMRRLGGSWLAVAAIDNALWDLRGRQAGAPVHALLGTRHRTLSTQGASRKEIALTEVEPIVDLMASARAEGLASFKMHLWGDAARDMRAVETIRSRVGADFGLVLDPMGRYGVEDAVTVGRLLERLSFLWFEDPVPAEQRDLYPLLASRLAIPLAAADALLWSRNDYTAAIEAGAPQILRLDPGRQGISFCDGVRRQAEAKGRRCEFHSFGPEPSSIASLHCAMAQADPSLYEICYPQRDFAVPGFATPASPSSDGRVMAPEKPGLGFDVDWAHLEKRVAWIASQ